MKEFNISICKHCDTLVSCQTYGWGCYPKHVLCVGNNIFECAERTFNFSEMETKEEIYAAIDYIYDHCNDEQF